jgi:hypothetical protein
MYVTARAMDPPVLPEDWSERWEGPDGGLLACWVNGLETARAKPDLALRAMAGELLPLEWRGGVEGPMKAKWKAGTLFYLAKWQGLRGDDLCIETNSQVTKYCTRTGVAVVFAQWPGSDS